MYKIGDYIIYQKEVCKVENIIPNYMDNNDYYILKPINDVSLKLNIPVNTTFIRNLINKNEIDKIMTNMTKIDIIKENDKMIETEYKRLLNTGNHEDLIKIIKTTYLRNKKRCENKKKISDKDKNYFEMAEKLLYTEFSIVLNMSFEETKKYVTKHLSKGNENE